MLSDREELYLKQLYQHPEIRGKINFSLAIAPFSDSLVYLVQEAWRKNQRDFVLKCGYDVLQRIDPAHFPPLPMPFKEEIYQKKTQKLERRR